MTTLTTVERKFMRRLGRFGSVSLWTNERVPGRLVSLGLVTEFRRGVFRFSERGRESFMKGVKNGVHEGWSVCVKCGRVEEMPPGCKCENCLESEVS